MGAVLVVCCWSYRALFNIEFEGVCSSMTGLYRDIINSDESLIRILCSTIVKKTFTLIPPVNR